MYNDLKELFLRNKSRIGWFTLVCWGLLFTDHNVIAFLKDHIWLGTIVNTINGALIASGWNIRSDVHHRMLKSMKDEESNFDLDLNNTKVD